MKWKFARGKNNNYLTVFFWQIVRKCTFCTWKLIKKIDKYIDKMKAFIFNISEQEAVHLKNK